MNLEQMILYQKRQLNNSNIINKLWSSIKSGEVQITKSEEFHFQKSLPLHLEDFFGECILKTKSYLERNETVDILVTLDYKYLCSLIHYMLIRTEVEHIDNITLLINVASLYLSLNCLPNSENTIYFDTLYLESVKVLDHVQTTDYKEPPLLMLLDDLRMFLLQSKAVINQDSLLQTINSLSHFLNLHNNTVFETFSIDGLRMYGGKTAFLTFMCYQAMIKKEFPNKLEMANTRLTVLLSLMNCFQSGIAPVRTLSVFQKNVQNFIEDVFPLLIIDDENLISKSVKIIIPNSQYDCYEKIALMLRVLPIEEYQALVQWIAYAMVSKFDGYKQYFSNIAVYIVKNSPDPAQFSKCEVIVELLTQNMIKLIADPNATVRENAIKNLEELLKVNDAYVNIALKRILYRDERLHNVNAKSIPVMLKKHSDFKWNKIALNQRIINILCHLMTIRRDHIFTQQIMEIVADLCFAAKSSSLKPCCNSFNILAESFLGTDDHVTKSIFKIYIFHIFKDNTSYFTKEFWKLVFGQLNLKKDKMETWRMANFLISEDFDCDKIIQKFSEEKLLDNELIQITISYLPTHDTAWKLLNLLCKYLKYTDWFQLERYIVHILTSKMFTDSSLYIFQCLNKMLENKTVNSDIEKGSLQLILTLFCNNLVSLSIPLHCLSPAIELISTISTKTSTFPLWAEDVFALVERQLQYCLNCILAREVESIAEVERSLVYSAELVTFARQSSLSEPNLHKLKLIVNPESQDHNLKEFLSRHPLIATQCLILFTKAMMLRGENDSKILTEILQKILSSSDSKCTLAALYALYDVCHVFFEYFDPVVPYLFALIDHKDPSVRLATVKIITECIDKGVIQLKDSRYLLFIAHIIDKDEEVKKTVYNYTKSTLFVQHEKCIAQNFLSSIFHFNRCHDHSMLALAAADIQAIKKKKMLQPELTQMFNFLFQNLSKKSQFSIVDQITKIVLEPALSDKSFYIQKEKYNVLETSLVLITKVAFLHGTISSIDTKDFYRDEVELVLRKIFDLKENFQKSICKNQHGIIKLVLKSLIRLIEKIDSSYLSIIELIFKTIVIFIKSFFNDVKYIATEDKKIKNLLKRFQEFHLKECDRFKYEIKYVPEDLELSFSVDV